MRAWIGTALLATSWLLGLGYFEDTNHFLWFCVLAAAVVFLADVPVRFPVSAERGVALLLLLPALWVVPLPYKAMVGLLSIGVVLSLAPIPRRWPRRLARGAAAAGVILLPQSLVLAVYQTMTARAHELPAFFHRPISLLAQLVGADAATNGATLSIGNASETGRVTATWELLFDPATICFVTGGLALLGLIYYGKRRTPTRGSLWQSALILLLLALAWAPLRLALVVSLVFQQALRAEMTPFSNVGELLVSTWTHFGLLGAFAILVGGVIPSTVRSTPNRSIGRPGRSADRTKIWKRAVVAGLCAASVATLTVLHFWVPVGARKDGRVMVVERHSTWEPTMEPYGTRVYGEAGSYNYAAIYDYCGQFYQMSRLLDEGEPIDDSDLEHCDILIIKTPTSRYSEEEVETVVRYVARGGSLLMIGDHTNVFNMNTYLNDVSRHFGFTFRNDLLFRVGNPYKQAYRPPKVAHPILQHVPPMTFAVSCSIDPGDTPGTMVVRNTGLWNLPPAYHESNYHPQAEYRPDMQYGAWCQMWSAVYGKGRVLAFADSTLFSNFCTFQPGKSELFVGMLEWLNHSSSFDSRAQKRVVTIPFVALSIMALAFSVWQIRRNRNAWLLPMAAGWTAWTVASLAVVQVHRGAMPFPTAEKKIPHVVIDRTISNVPLFTGAFADDTEGGGYGMLEQWVPRIGNITISRRSGQDAFIGEGVIIICPTRLPSRQYRNQLVQWVESGGRLMVFDTPDVQESTANSILSLFQLQSIHNIPEQTDQPIRLANGELETPLQASCQIAGGEPIALWGEIPVAAHVEIGEGSVTAIGFGSLFNDAGMGFHWLPEPEPDVLQRYEFLYALLRAGLK